MRLYKLLLPLIFFGLTQCSNGQQTITGSFPQLANQTIKLEGFNGFKTYVIDSVQVSENGAFKLRYDVKDFGMGYLLNEEEKSFIVVLSGNAIAIEGVRLDDAPTVKIIEGGENQFFEQYASEHARREQALSAWVYLEKIYRNDSLFAGHKKAIKAIELEKQRIKIEDSSFLAKLDPKSYVGWYLPFRKLISSVSVVAQYRTEEIPSTIAAFRNLDYTDDRLFKSGLLRDVIDSHFWLIENSGRPLDSVFVEMKISIDHMVEALMVDEQKLNEISDYLFKLLEKRSLFEASEYLALKLLNENGCTLNSDLASQLESYRAMKKGNTAPNFAFSGDNVMPGYNTSDAPKELSDLESEYTVVVFGASWCPQCPGELTSIARLYEKWKEQEVEVVFVSLDTDKQIFNRFAGNFPFISVCDYQKWDSPILEAYYVFATPTIYLLDNKRKILLRPNSVKHLDSWVDWHLVKGNEIK
ncbi:MAG: TlpA disulfide reductase family protein [Salinivirgaceae bacterium]|jgi:thiol-disulfide isomerase/thioredoxin|nr:TlpA disulfide reductase family protein [Salinivirgaceae bacterium]